VLLPGVARRRDELPDQTRWVTLSGCGHIPMFDDPQAVVDLLLRSTDPDTAASPSADRPAGSPPTVRARIPAMQSQRRGHGTVIDPADRACMRLDRAFSAVAFARFGDRSVTCQG
jgi:hypothetical protein